MITIKTGRLILRVFREADQDDYVAICDDPEVMRYLGEGKPLSRAEAWRQMALLLGHWQLRGYRMWAVEEPNSHKLIGRIGCFQPEGWPGLEIGWTLGRPYWGQGYATEGGRAALGYAFRTLNQGHVISLIQPGNLASIRVAERLGSDWRGGAR
jgi:RimJ/RimL family protein N-acetyltransferase